MGVRWVGASPLMIRKVTSTQFDFHPKSLPPPPVAANLFPFIAWPVPQVLVLYHEMMPYDEMTDYFARMLWPLTPLAVMGRSWQADPKCPREQAVFSNWRDLTISNQTTTKRLSLL